jgi:23S rRNA (uracil1939-C5)-methyltransferase
MRLTIEKMIYGGDGLARITSEADARAKATFIPFTVAGEEMEAQVFSDKRGFSRAVAKEILTPSPDRITPGCEYFFRCGGCQYQHISYTAQLRFKESILRETLLRFAKLDWQEPIAVHSAEPWGYRNRTRLHIQHGVGDGQFAAGYFRHGSHQLLPITHCPISSPAINRAISVLLRLGTEKSVPKSLKEIEFFADASDAHLLLELHCVDPETRELEEFWKRWQESDANTLGASAFSMPNERFPQAEELWQGGKNALDYKVLREKYRVSAGSFFQINRFLTEKMVEVVTSGERGEAAIDLYSGAGLFTLPLAKAFSSVKAVEIAPFSFADLLQNSPKNVECVQKTVEDFVAGKMEEADLVVLDPPRAGLGEKEAAKLAKWRPQRITYVSCDPATLARDLKVLLKSGYRAVSIDLLDLFPQTFHLETVVKLELSR